MKRQAYLCILIFMTVSLQAQTTPKGVPTKLFGVTLGSVYDVGDGANNFGDLPVARFAGMRTFLGHGVHYYFKPKSENKAFPYIEKKKRPDDKTFETSYRLYLLPVIPPTTKTVDQLEHQKQKWEVATIEWSDTAETKDDAYYWAIDLCETFQMDIGSKPVVIDNHATKWHKCIFASGNREFSVSNLQDMRIVELAYKHDVLERKDKAVESVLRRLRADQIRPY
ncbi:MAG: hypothetical protein M3P29_03680 [Acidobacteriota bacterium]|nr:hypothetical protein [Acidobacteriota bacterium]